MKDLRTFLESLAKERPGEVVRISREVSPELEITTLLAELERKGCFPITLFEKVRNLHGRPSGIKVVSNLFASRKKIAWALGLPLEKNKGELAREYLRGRENRLPPVVINKKDAPVKDIVRKDNPDLYELPVVTHHEMDSGPYLTMAVVAKDPDTGVYNSSFQRMWVKSAKETGISIAPRHLWDYYLRYEKRGQPMPVAVILGHHPAFCLGSMAGVPLEVDEYEVIGGLLGEPLRLVESESFGPELLVPADAEIVVEGEVPPRARDVDGPFGEYTGYYGGQKLNPVFVVRAVTFRREPILQTVFVGHRDIDYLMGVPMEGDVLAAVRTFMPSVIAVHVPPSGKCLNCYISIKKNRVWRFNQGKGGSNR